MRLTVRLAAALCALAAATLGCTATAAGEFGPFNLTLLEGGIGDERPLPADTVAAAAAAAQWSLSGWVNPARRQAGAVIVAAIGETAAWRGLQIDDGAVEFAAAPGALLRGPALTPAHWVHVAATYDGRSARLYVDGAEVAAAPAAIPAVAPRLALAPVVAAVDAAAADGAGAHFGGSLALFTLSARALSAADVAAQARARPDFALLTFTRVGAGWPLQAHAWRGLLVPQDPWTLPHGAGAPSAARALPKATDVPALRMVGVDRG